MQPSATSVDRAAIDAFVSTVGRDVWRARLRALQAAAGAQTHAGRQCLQRHCIELTLERLRAQALARPASAAERCIAGYAADAVARLDTVAARGRDGLLGVYRAGLVGDETLVGPFHLLRTAGLQAARGYEVQFAGLEDGAPFDLLIANETVEAEVACDVISAEDGRGVHRGAWFDLVDRVDPELQTWLRAHPGRYLLKMTLPQGLKMGPQGSKSDDGTGLLGVLHERITAMLAGPNRTDGDAAAMLRLDPLMLNAAQADELGLMPRLRREFGPEAHLSVTAAGGGVFVMAARAGQENEVAGAVRRRLDAIAPARLTGTRPGILAVFIEDTDRVEWRLLREQMLLEGETRHFLTHPEARSVVAVTCVSRLELFGLTGPDTAPDGELRFRNPAHPAAKLPGLAAAVASSS